MCNTIPIQIEKMKQLFYYIRPLVDDRSKVEGHFDGVHLISFTSGRNLGTKVAMLDWPSYRPDIWIVVTSTDSFSPVPERLEDVSACYCSHMSMVYSILLASWTYHICATHRNLISYAKVQHYCFLLWYISAGSFMNHHYGCWLRVVIKKRCTISNGQFRSMG